MQLLLHCAMQNVSDIHVFDSMTPENEGAVLCQFALLCSIFSYREIEYRYLEIKKTPVRIWHPST